MEVLQRGSLDSKSAGTKLAEISLILNQKHDRNPKSFDSAINDFYKGVMSMEGQDGQLVAALCSFGKDRQEVTEEAAEIAVKKWEQFLTIKSRDGADDKFKSVTNMALHPSGDIALIDKIQSDMWSGKKGAPRVYVFSQTGSQKCVLNSTLDTEEPVGELVNAQGIAVTNDGKYVITDGSTLVKVFDAAGHYLDSFTTLSEDARNGVKASARCITVNPSNGDVLVGDYHREMITVHDGGDFKIKKEVYVDLKPVHITVNSKNQILVTVLMLEPAEVEAVNLFFLVLKHNKAGGKVVAFDYEGDDLFTIVPVLGGELARPMGVVYDSNGGIFMAVMKFDIKSRMNKANSGHIHYYDSEGKFVKCIAKGLYWPMGMALKNGVLAVGDKESAKIYKSE